MLIYVICLIVLGLPTMIMEFSVGRAAQTSPLYMYRKLSGGRGKWNLWGIVCLIGNIALIAFYAVVSGWILYYFVKFLTGQNQDFGFEKMITTPSVNVTYLLFTLLIAFVILSFHLQGGLERITKYMMSALIVLMLVLAVHSFTLPGAGEGLSFYLIQNHRFCGGGRHESGIFHLVRGNGRYGDLRKLYRQGPFSHGGVYSYYYPGYTGGSDCRYHYISGMLYL